MASSKQEYHERLHSKIQKARKFSEAIFYDLKYDVDKLASERTAERLNIVDNQYGPDAVFGILANWALNIAAILRAVFPNTGHEDFNVVPFLPQDLNFKELGVGERAEISASQFVTALAHDDLEMAEAIFLAARNSSIEDATALVSVILGTYINIYEKYCEDSE